MDLAGIVKVRVEADTKPLEQGMGRAKKTTEEYARTSATAYSRTSAAARQSNTKIVSYAREATNATKKQSAAVGMLAKAFKGAAGPMAAFGAAAAATIGAGALVRTLANFGDEMAKVKAVTRATEAEFQTMRDTAKSLGSTTEFSASQVAEGLKFLGQAGFEASEAVATIPSVLDLATASAMGLGQAADITSNIMSAFGIAAQDSAAVADSLAAIASRANTNVAQLGDGMSYVGPVAAALGISVGDAAAAMGVLADAGIQGAAGGTGLRRVLSSLASPTKEAADTLNRLGVSLKDVDPAMNSITDIVDELAGSGMDAADALTIFGDRGGPAILALTSQNGRLKELTEEMQNVSGAATDMANIMRDTLGGDIKGVYSAVEGLILALGDAGLTAILRVLAQAFTGIVRNITDMVSIAGSVISTMLAPFKMLGVSVGTTATAIEMAGTVLFTFFGARAAGMVIKGLWGMVTAAGSLGTAFTVLGGAASKALTLIRVGLTAIMAGNPIGLAVTALVTLVGVMWQMRDTFKPIGKMFDWIFEKATAIFEGIKEGWRKLMETMGWATSGENSVDVTVKADESLQKLPPSIEEAHKKGGDDVKESISDAYGEAGGKSGNKYWEGAGETVGKEAAKEIEGAGGQSGKRMGEEVKNASDRAADNYSKMAKAAADYQNAAAKKQQAESATMFKAAGIELSKESARILGQAGRNVANIMGVAIGRALEKTRSESNLNNANAKKARAEAAVLEQQLPWHKRSIGSFAGGGWVSGGGTGTSDSVPAMLSDGEFVVNARQTKRYGDMLDAINSGRIDQMAKGGKIQMSAAGYHKNWLPNAAFKPDSRFKGVKSMEARKATMDNALAGNYDERGRGHYDVFGKGKGNFWKRGGTNEFAYGQVQNAAQGAKMSGFLNNKGDKDERYRLAYATYQQARKGGGQIEGSFGKKTTHSSISGTKNPERFMMAGDPENQNGAGMAQQPTNIVNLMDPNQMVNVLGTAAGTNKIVNTIKDNSDEIRQVLGVK